MVSLIGKLSLGICLVLGLWHSANSGSPVGAPVRMSAGPSLSAPEVASVAFSPDGKLLASAGYDKLIHLWDARSGKEIRCLSGNRDWVSAVTFSPDGKTLASGSRDWTVRLWDAATGKELRRFEGPQGGVLSVAFSPDGRLLLAGCQDKAVYMWEVASSDDLFRSQAHVDWVTSVAFSSDGKTMASASWDGTFRLRDTATREEPRRFGKGHGRFLALAFAPDGQLVATASQNKGISLWEIATGKELRMLGEEQHRALCLAFSPDGKLLAAGCKDGTIRWWQTATGKELRPLGESQNRVLGLSFSPDGKFLASGNGNSILVWNLGEGVEHPVPDVSFTRDKLEGLWADLAKPNAPQAHRAMWGLAQAPKQTVAFLQSNLRPVTVDGQHINRLITELDSPKFSVRQKATQELEQVGKFAETALRQTLQSRPSLEVRQRVERLLARVEGERCVPYHDALRAGRALKVLARLDVPEAQQLLRTLAQGAAESWLTQEAKATLDRQRVLGQRR